MSHGPGTLGGAGAGRCRWVHVAAMYTACLVMPSSMSVHSRRGFPCKHEQVDCLCMEEQHTKEQCCGTAEDPKSLQSRSQNLQLFCTLFQIPQPAQPTNLRSWPHPIGNHPHTKPILASCPSGPPLMRLHGVQSPIRGSSASEGPCLLETGNNARPSPPQPQMHTTTGALANQSQPLLDQAQLTPLLPQPLAPALHAPARQAHASASSAEQRLAYCQPMWRHCSPAYRAAEPSSSSMRSSWLYLALRSERQGAPVLIWPVDRPTARSAMKESSVSPAEGTGHVSRGAWGQLQFGFNTWLAARQNAMRGHCVNQHA